MRSLAHVESPIWNCYEHVTIYEQCTKMLPARYEHMTNLLRAMLLLRTCYEHVPSYSGQSVYCFLFSHVRAHASSLYLVIVGFRAGHIGFDFERSVAYTCSGNVHVHGRSCDIW